MGGCYRYTPPARSSSSSTSSLTKIKKKLDKFFKTKEVETLIEAYRDYEKLGKDSGFFKFIMDHKGVSEAPKEFSDTELESKLKVLLIKEGKTAEPKPEKILDAIEFPPTRSAQYIKDAVNTVTTGENHFFGTDDGEERFVVINKKGGWYLKEKGPVEPCSMGIPGERLVLRRKETRIPTDPLQAMKTLVERYDDGRTKYQGGITKVKADAFFMNTQTGRMYGMTFTDAKRNGTEQRQMQLELEYAGYIPGLDIDLDNEASIVEDIVNINKQILLLYNNIRIVRGWRLRFAPTSERKYDFVSNKQVDSESEESIEALLSIPQPLMQISK